MTNIRSLAIVTSVFILCAAAAYYLAIILPVANQQEFVIEQQQKCRDAGEKAYKADLQRYNVDALEEPRYAYSEELNTCIYSSGYHDYGSPSAGVGGDILPHNCDANWERWVKNSYTNEKILEVSNWLYNCEWMTDLETIQTFEIESDNLFKS